MAVLLRKQECWRAQSDFDLVTSNANNGSMSQSVIDRDGNDTR